MKRTCHRTLIVAAAASLLAIPLVHSTFAQSGNLSSASSTANSAANRANAQLSRPAQQGRHDMHASRLIGMEVKNSQGQSLGEIQDLYVDAIAQRVPYVSRATDGLI